MKKYFVYFLSVALLLSSVFTVNALTPSVASAQSMTISQLIELLISIGAIAPDKVVAARNMAVQLTLAATTASVGTSTASIASSSLPYVQVLSPNGGEVWQINVGVPYAITWGTSKQIPVIVSLVPTKGAVCNLNILPITTTPGDNIYKVLLKTALCYNLTSGTSTPLVDGIYKARVSYKNSAGAVVSDDSNASFTIQPIPVPSIKVTYPNGGEKLTSNTRYNIKYTLKNTTERGIKITILNYQGSAAYTSSGIGTNGSYNFYIPSSVNAGAYKLQLEMTASDGTKIMDTSDNPFWISDSI